MQSGNRKIIRSKLDYVEKRNDKIINIIIKQKSDQA